MDIISKEKLSELRNEGEPRDLFDEFSTAVETIDHFGIMGTWSSIGSLPSLGKTVKKFDGNEQLIWDRKEKHTMAMF